MTQFSDSEYKFSKPNDERQLYITGVPSLLNKKSHHCYRQDLWNWSGVDDDVWSCAVLQCGDLVQFGGHGDH